MTMRRHFALLLLLAATPALAQPQQPTPTPEPPRLSIPAEVAAQPGQWVVVVPDTNAKAVTYVALDGLSAFPSSELKDPRKLVVNAPPSGRYRFVAVGTLNDEQAVASFVIVVGGTPPGPGPTPPAPSDPLWPALQTAYGAEVTTTKTVETKKLAEVYRAAAATTVNNPALTTLGMLYDAVAGAAQVVVPLPALRAVREVLATDFKTKLPTDRSLPLDATLRAKCADNFKRAAALLEALAR